MAKAKIKDINPWEAKGAKHGSGDYYGSGVRNPVGKLRDFGINPVSKKGLTKPPKKLA